MPEAVPEAWMGPGWVSVESENRVTTIDPSRLYGFQMDWPMIDPCFGRWKYTFDHNGRSKEQCESQEADVALAMATELETQVVQDIFQHDPWKHGEKGEKGYKSI